MEKLKDVNDRNTGTGTTLSKAGLYAPLSVSRRVDDPNLLSKPRKLASLLKDGALVDFLVQVGINHNRRAAISVGKNNGSKPLSQNEVNDRVRMKALTLVGGGINLSISGAPKKVKASLFPRSQVSNTKRKRTSFVCEKYALCEPQAWATLEKVNKTWNDYIVRLLQDEGIDLESTNVRSLTRRLSKVASGMEMVGSFVSIVKCQAHKQLVSKKGFIVGETLNTWRLATLPTKIDENKPVERFCTVLTVPKGVGTELIVSVRFTSPEHPSEGNLGEEKTLKICIK